MPQHKQRAPWPRKITLKHMANGVKSASSRPGLKPGSMKLTANPSPYKALKVCSPASELRTRVSGLRCVCTADFAGLQLIKSPAHRQPAAGNLGRRHLYGS